MTNITKPTRAEVSERNYSVYLGVPFPAAFAETVGCVLEHDLISLLDIDLVEVCEVSMKEKIEGEGTYCLISDLLSECRDRFWFNG